MLVLTLVVPAEYTTQVLLALLFWAGNILFEFLILARFIFCVDLSRFGVDLDTYV